MFGHPDYNNNKTRVSLHDIVRQPPETLAPVARKKLPTGQRHQIFQKIVEESKRAEQLRKEHFKNKYNRKSQHSPPPIPAVFTPERMKIGLQSKEVTVDQIMDKVSKIKEEIVMKKRALSHQKLSKVTPKPIGVIDCCAQALNSSAGFVKYNSIKQVEHPKEEMSRSKIVIRPLTRQKSASARVIENPKSVMDRAVNFLIKQIDIGGSTEEKTEVACKVYKNLKGDQPDAQVQHKIKTILTAKKSPVKQQKLSSTPPNERIGCNGSSIAVTKFQPLGNSNNKNSPMKYSPDLHQHKYEIPFNEDTERKQRFLKKGSNITGMILQHIFKGQHRDEVDHINFQKQKFMQEYNQTLPEELSNRWKEDIQRSLKILKGKFSKRPEVTKPDKYGGFAMDDVIYLCDNKKLFFDRNLNDYYEDGSEPAWSPHAP